MRVFVGCSDIAGFQSRAARALARAGHKVRYLNISPHPYNPELADDSGVVRVLPGAFRLTSRLRRGGFLLRPLGAALRAVLLWVVLLTTLPRTDAYIFAGRRSLFSGCGDLRLLRLFGKRVVHFFMGSDSRPAYLGSIDGGEVERRVTPEKLDRLARQVARQRRRLGVIDRFVSEVSENPLCGYVHGRRCLNWYRLGYPLSGAAFRVNERLAEAAREERDGTVRILHCPSKLGTKGTREIEDCLARLREDGLAIDYVRITNMPHSEVLDQLARCDFVIDQLYSDSAFSGFASEAALFGKPAVIGGWGWEAVAASTPEEARPPSVTCRPEELDATLKRLVEDAAHREEMGRRARVFAEEVWNEEAVAARLTKVLQGEIPDDWYFEPESTVYVEGCGMAEDLRRKLLRAFVARHGIEALRLEDKPAVKDAIVAFATSE